MADENKPGKLTIDIELKDLLGAVAKGIGGSGTSPISENSHAAEAQDITKAWVKSTYDVINNVALTLENVRSKELPELKSELRRDITKLETRLDKNDTVRVEKEALAPVKENLGKLETKVEKQIEAFETLKTKTIKPLSDSLIAISVKIGIYGLIAGFIGSGLMAFVVYVLQLAFHHAAGTPPPKP